MHILNLIESEEQLDEASLKQVAAAAAFLGAALIGAHQLNKPSMVEPVKAVKMLPDEGIRVAPEAKNPKIAKLVSSITSKYKVDPTVATQIVTVAKKHAKPDFPRTEDILTVIGIESSFNHIAKSGLKKDPARGLMQVRPGIWKIPEDELHKIDDQIAHGVKILSYYYSKLKNREEALRAYNLGITRHLKDKQDPSGAKYVEKFKKEQQLYM